MSDEPSNRPGSNRIESNAPVAVLIAFPLMFMAAAILYISGDADTAWAIIQLVILIGVLLFFYAMHRRGEDSITARHRALAIEARREGIRVVHRSE